jgi:hypothetical protein
MSAINDTLERIAKIQMTIVAADAARTAIVEAYPYMPSQAISANCPFFINELMGGESDIPISAGQQYLAATIPMVLCVTRKEANTGLQLGVDTTVEWVEAVYAMFSQHVRLSDPVTPFDSLGFIIDAVIKKWEPGTYAYADAEFLSIKFHLAVRMMYPTTITA